MILTEKDEKELNEIIEKANKLKAEVFINRVALNTLFNLGKREQLITEYGRLLELRYKK